ncbi:Hypothetical protein D9617_23g006040 [Elsinoe fawcettii]|nr:Hypothetical protein D9617_23g006040 [Elsinoe fawcettii]
MKSIALSAALLSVVSAGPLQARQDSYVACSAGASTTGKLNAAFRDPAFACYWFSNRNLRVSPVAGLDSNAIVAGCPCFLQSPSDAKSTLPKAKANGDKNLATISNVVSDPKGFCTYWLTENIKDSSPFSKLSVDQIRTACTAIVGKQTPVKNRFQNPYFSGSGWNTGDGVYRTLNLPYWDSAGGSIAVEQPAGNDPVGNRVVLGTQPNYPYAEISQRPLMIYRETPGKLTFNALTETSGDATCRQEVLYNRVSIWNSTTTEADTRKTKKNVLLPSKQETVTFPYDRNNTGATFTFRVNKIAGNMTSTSCNWYIAKVSVY